LGPSAGDTQNIILQGILADAQNPRALINNNNVGIGDRVGKYTIVDIKQDKVILNDGSDDRELIFEY